MADRKGIEKRLEQIDIFSTHLIEEKDNKIEKVMNNIKNKYGSNSILRCTSYSEGSTQRNRNKLVGGHIAE
ncbi:MAG: hypothetical protein ACK5HP_03555 [Bacilli bacterium]